MNIYYWDTDWLLKKVFFAFETAFTENFISICKYLIVFKI